MATPTVLKLGSYNYTTDTFGAHPAAEAGAVYDLNDGTTWTLLDSGNGLGDGLDLGMPQASVYTVGNTRSVGRRIVRRVYESNRVIRARLMLLPQTSYANFTNALHALITLLEGITPAQPAALQIQPPGSSTPVYADVISAQLVEQFSEMLYAQLVTDGIEIVFECLPHLHGPRQWLQNLVFNPGFEAPSAAGTIVFNDNFANVNAYTVEAGSAPTVVSNVMTMAAASRVAFGSPNWGAVQNWQVRWQWITGLNAVFYLHFTNANNWLGASITGTTMTLIHTVGGTQHTLATVSSLGLVNSNFYWIKLVQFPALLTTSGNAPWVQASLYNDTGPGSIGTQVQTTAGPIQCFDNVTALAGQCTIQANSAALAIGGNFTTGVNQVSLWGPGTWTFTAENSTTGQAAGAWESNTANVYRLGPFASNLAARIDFPPAGTVNAFWNLYTGGAVANTGAMPVSIAGAVMGVSCYVRSTGLSGSAQVTLWLREFDTSGSHLRDTAVATHTGNVGGTYLQLSGTVTTGANTVYADIQLNALDTSVAGASAGAAVWFENVLCWDQTATGMTSMPYTETRYVQTPAQLQISGLLGDVPAPATLCYGVFVNSLPTGTNAVAYLGRRANADNAGTGFGPGAQLIGYIENGSPTLDTTAYGGYRVAANPGIISCTMGQIAGTYELIARCQTANAAPTGIWVAPQINARVAAAANTPSIGNDVLLSYTLGTQFYPFSAQNTWAIADLGQVALPPSPSTIEGDSTTLVASVSTSSGGSGGSQLTTNYVALLPKDGELHVADIISPTGATTITNQWLYTYFDGRAGACTISEVWPAPLANPTQSASSFGSTTYLSTLGVSTGGNNLLVSNPTASVFPKVDPSLLTLHSGGLGVNQYLALGVNNNNANLPSVALDVIYWPLYTALT